MQKVKFLRKGHVIRTLKADGTFSDEHFKGRRHPKGPDFSSVSAAKRASRKLQEAHGGVGCGVLRVVKDWPQEQQS
jgi:hypothetical protein